MASKLTLSKLVDDYYLSFEYKNLRKETQQQYEYFLSQFLQTKIQDKMLQDYKYKDISTRMAKESYNMWCDRGVYFANHVMSVARIVYNFGIDMEYCSENPFRYVKRRTVTPRKIVWTKDNVNAFLTQAYSDFKTRNIGLIAQMAYEWCQRLGDMRLLQWTDLDLPMQKVHIKQSKRRAEVFLPISDDLCSMLTEQERDFGFQEYIAPRPKAYNKVYRPYTLYKLPQLARKVMDSAGLSRELRLSDLRRTGTTEMVDAGVSMGNIMAVTGHANPQSVKPYMKNTFTSANLALNTRKQLT